MSGRFRHRMFSSRKNHLVESRASEGVIRGRWQGWVAMALPALLFAACSSDAPGGVRFGPEGSEGVTDGSGGGNPGAGGNEGTGGSGQSGGSAGASDRGCDRALSEANRGIVATALDELFVDKDLSAIDRYWAEPYDQHNPAAASGVEPFRNLMSSFVTSPSFEYERVRTLGECDLVIVQGIYSATGIIFDLFRLRDGKLVEHWDSDSNQASESGGPTAIEDVALTASNRALVLDFIERVLIEDEHADAPDYLDADYVEHRAVSATGPQGFLEYVEEEAIHYVKVHHVIADGNFVFTLSEGELGGEPYGFYDLFRLEDGAIVEHWDSRRVVPESTVSGLDIF